MSLTAKSSLSLKKKDVVDQKNLAIGFKKLTFAHKASGGATGISLGSLVVPTEMSGMGFTNPSSGELLASKLFFFRKNLTLISSLRGVLMDYVSYDVASSSQINFNGFTAEDGEIFIGIIDHVAKTGVNIVDAAPLVSTGTLAVGVTDYNVGQLFEVNKYDSQQVGAVIVYRNGDQVFRNTNNSSVTLDGNYYEVNNGSGSGQIIRFNNAPVGQEDNILVISNGLLAYSPDDSALQQIETLAGQIDAMVPTLAALAGVPESAFQVAPSNADLKSFGDLVILLKTKLETFDEYDYVEFSGATIPPGSRIAPATQLQNLSKGAFDVSTVPSNGQFKVLKSGFYNFTCKMQFAAGAYTASITRGNSQSVNGNNTAVLISVVPTSGQEFQMSWTGYLVANDIVGFNTNGVLSANSAVQMFYGSYLGKRNIA